MLGSSELTAEMDVYSYAICCVEILSMGRLPWPLMTDEAVRNFVLSMWSSILSILTDYRLKRTTLGRRSLRLGSIPLRCRSCCAYAGTKTPLSALRSPRSSRRRSSCARPLSSRSKASTTSLLLPCRRAVPTGAKLKTRLVRGHRQICIQYRYRRRLVSIARIPGLLRLLTLH